MHKTKKIHYSSNTKNISISKSKSTPRLNNCYGYSVNAKSEYQVLFKAFSCCAKEEDW